MNKPKNCPFCGSKLVNICYHTHGCHSVECLECKIRTGEYGGFQSVDVWNKRPNHDRMVDEIAELRDMLKSAKFTMEKVKKHHPSPEGHDCEMLRQNIVMAEKLLNK